jgi:hypothetical protein
MVKDRWINSELLAKTANVIIEGPLIKKMELGSMRVLGVSSEDLGFANFIFKYTNSIDEPLEFELNIPIELPGNGSEDAKSDSKSNISVSVLSSESMV